jgi:phthalate 4,5-dioxygenase oxygenase subunit
MLTKEQNDAISKVGPGTPMGEFMRQFWVPACRADALVADGAPVRVRLLGENFVAFRASDGRVGFFDEGCPHRCTSLALARNEDNALTCIFHGWKIDVSGKVVEVPSEPPERRNEFAAKVRVGHYPVREAARIIFVYLGKSDTPPAFPNFNFTNLPDSHVAVQKQVIKCNWLNLLEGQLDSAHVSFLHRNGSTRRGPGSLQVRGDILFDTGPRFEVEPRPYGLTEAAIRRAPGGNFYVRVREYIMPWYSSVPQGAKGVDRIMTIAQPIDDETAAHWDVLYNLDRPLERRTGNGFSGFWDAPEAFLGDIGTFENHFKQNRQEMKEWSWSGFPNGRYEDAAAAIAQGVVCDRSREYLGSSDTVIIKARRMLLDLAMRNFRGERAFDQAAFASLDWKIVEPVDATIPPTMDWRQLARD